MIIRGILGLVAVMCASPAIAGPKLWGDFEARMKPQEVVDLALKLPGVNGAKIKEKKTGVEVDVSHGMSSKFEVAGKKSRLSFSFRNGVLFAVEISPEPYEFGLAGCIREGMAAFRYYDKLLSNKYDRNYAATPEVDDFQVNDMILRANLAALKKERYRVPIDSMAEGFTDGKVQIINRVRFVYLSVGLCGRQGNLRGYSSIAYMDKADFEADLKSKQDSRDRVIDSLSSDL